MVGRRLKQVFIGGAVAAMVLIGAGLLYSRATGVQLLSVQTGSMVPVLHKGDLVTVTRVPHGQLAVRDVITYMSPRDKRATITHRIIALPTAANDYRIVTKGDANALADPPVRVAAVLGKVQYRAPLAGFAVDAVRKPIGLLLCIYIPALAIMADELRRLTAYYKTQQVYRMPGRGLRLRRSSSMPHDRLALGLKTITAGAVAGLLIIVPAHAALTSTATLMGSSIAATRTAPLTHILFRSVAFECSLDNTGTANKLPGILLYNPGKTDTPTGNWYIQSSKGRVVTFRPQTVFDAQDDYDIEPDLKTGINYAGDYLALFDSAGKVVDAISWGTDTTYLNPALPGTLAGATFRRVTLVTDTDGAADWAVSVSACVTVPRE
ncbi:MAG: signal peptidase I [Candidatus Saccharimonadales bacterium]